MRKKVFRFSAFAALIILVIISCKQQRSDIIIADFESDSYGDWITEGNAFGTGPAKGSLPGQIEGRTVDGYLGENLVNSFSNGEDSKGKLTSPSFTIERKYINFLVGGGKSPGKTCINLLVDNKVVRTVPDPEDWSRSSGLLEWATWDVSEWPGKAAVIQIIDEQSGYWGYITVD
jgi:fructan beta-fructosidase